MNSKYVEIKKLSPVKNPEAPTPNKEDYIYGEINFGTSIPVEYTVTGHMLVGPTVGQSLTVFRDTRNGVKVDGVFQTSKITCVEEFENEIVFCTLNSKYKLKYIEE